MGTIGDQELVDGTTVPITAVDLVGKTYNSTADTL